MIFSNYYLFIRRAELARDAFHLLTYSPKWLQWLDPGQAKARSQKLCWVFNTGERSHRLQPPSHIAGSRIARTQSHAFRCGMWVSQTIDSPDLPKCLPLSFKFSLKFLFGQSERSHLLVCSPKFLHSWGWTWDLCPGSLHGVAESQLLEPAPSLRICICKLEAGVKFRHSSVGHECLN